MNIAFIIGAFPSLPETFILNQITGLIDLGHSVYIFPKYEGKGICHSEISSYDLKSSSIYPVSPNHNILVRYLKTIPIVFALIFKGNKQAAMCLNVFKFGRQALNLRLFYQVLPFLNKNIDIIQVHYADYLDRAVLLKKLGIKAPVILMMHRYDLRKLIESDGQYYSESFKYVDKFLAISNYSYKTLASYGVPEEKIVFHPVGIDTESYGAIVRSVTNRKEIIILSVGRLALIKGHKYGLEAFSIIRKKLIDLRITYRIVGFGPELENLQRIAAELNIREEVIFTGPKNRDEILQEYMDADILLHPSLDEMTPVVIMEALASGLPVIATNVAAVAELVHHEENGFLVELNNTEQMAAYLKTLISNPGLRNELGCRGRSHIAENYDIVMLNRRLEEIYLTCLQK